MKWYFWSYIPLSLPLVTCTLLRHSADISVIYHSKCIKHTGYNWKKKKEYIFYKDCK